MKVLVGDAGNLYLSLPPRLQEGELSDEQREAVAGGDVAFFVTLGVVARYLALLILDAHSRR